MVMPLSFSRQKFRDSLAAAPAESSSEIEAADQVRVLSGILQEMPDRMKLKVLDLFEEKRDYYTRAPSTDLSIIEYAYRAPDSDAFTKEMDLLQSIRTDATSKRCLLVQTSFSVPGKQVFQILLRHPLHIEGGLARLSVWIHSPDSLNAISVLMRNPRGQRVEVRLGALAWKGWKRITVNLPADRFRTGKDQRYKSGGSFEGFLIRSHPLEEAGPMSIMIDNLLLLTDQSKLMYPGAEIDDNWGK